MAGSVLGLLSLPLGWLTIRPSRLAAGTSLSLWQALGWEGGAFIIAIWLFCFSLSLKMKGRAYAATLGMAANLNIIATFTLVGLAAKRLISEQPDFARVSLGAGIWINLIAAYILVFAASQRLDQARLLRNLISWAGLVALATLLVLGWLNDLSLLREFRGREERFAQEAVQHVFLFGVSVFIGTLIGVPLGIWTAQSKRAEKPIFFTTNIAQTIPSLALFGLLIAPLSALSTAFPLLRELGIRGVGAAPAVIALIIYSLLPIVRNTHVSLRQIDPAIIDAGLGMGMSRSQIFRRLEVPLATPLVVQGIRIASVQAVGNVAVAALIGAGGLGHFIFEGLGQAAPDLIILGALPIIGLALIVDGTMRVLGRAATPKGVAVHSE